MVPEFHFSGVSRLSYCPAAYALRAQGVQGPYMLRGTLVHQALEEYVRLCASEGRSMDSELMDALIAKYVMGSTLPSEEKDYAVGLLRGFGQGYDLTPSKGFTYLAEHEMACLLYPEGGVIVARHVPQAELVEMRKDDGRWHIESPGAVLVVSTLDRVALDAKAGLVVVTDWKTNRSIKPASDVKYELQGRFYAVQAFALTGAEQAQVRVVYLNGLRTESFDMDPQAIADAVEEVYQLCVRAGDIDGMKCVDARPTPGSGCATCDVAHVCPASKDVLARLRLDGASGRLGDAAFSASDYPILKRLTDDLGKILREQADEAPVTLANGDFIGFKNKVRTKLMDGWQTFLEEDYGLTLEDLVAAGTTQASIKKYLRSRTDTADAVGTIMQAITVEETYTEFGVHGAADKD